MPKLSFDDTNLGTQWGKNISKKQPKYPVLLQKGTRQLLHCKAMTRYTISYKYPKDFVMLIKLFSTYKSINFDNHQKGFLRALIVDLRDVWFEWQHKQSPLNFLRVMQQFSCFFLISWIVKGSDMQHL